MGDRARGAGNGAGGQFGHGGQQLGWGLKGGCVSPCRSRATGCWRLSVRPVWQCLCFSAQGQTPPVTPPGSKSHPHPHSHPAPSSFSESLVKAHPKNKLLGSWMQQERARTQSLNKHRRGVRVYKVLVHLRIIQLVHFVLCHLCHMPRQPFKYWSFPFIFVASRIIFPSVGRWD